MIGMVNINYWISGTPSS